jgi:hypothetical protein
VLALGRLTSAGYSVIASIGVIIAFNRIKFLLIEVPIISYMLGPDRTAARLDRHSAWLREHQIKAIAAGGRHRCHGPDREWQCKTEPSRGGPRSRSADLGDPASVGGVVL